MYVVGHKHIGMNQTPVLGRFLTQCVQVKFVILFVKEYGLSVHATHEGRTLSWPRVSCSFDFKAPLRFDDEFECHLEVERCGSKSVTYAVRIMRGDTLIASGRTTTVCCDLAEDGSLSAVAIPETFLSKLKST